jgi:hypothetical protein
MLNLTVKLKVSTSSFLLFTLRPQRLTPTAEWIVLITTPSPENQTYTVSNEGFRKLVEIATVALSEGFYPDVKFELVIIEIESPVVKNIKVELSKTTPDVLITTPWDPPGPAVEKVYRIERSLFIEFVKMIKPALIV